MPTEKFNDLVRLAGDRVPSLISSATVSDTILARESYVALLGAVDAALDADAARARTAPLDIEVGHVMTQDFTSTDGLQGFEAGSIVLSPDEYKDLVSRGQSRAPTRLGLPEVFQDLDGCLADFDAHFPAVFGQSQKGLPDDVMWAMIDDHPSYFLDMPLMPGALEFFESIRHLDPTILTACPKSSYTKVATQKRQWVRRELGTDVRVLPVMGGRNKVLFMHNVGDILIDDWSRNCDAWTAGGGVAIRHRSFAETAEELSAALSAHHSSEAV